MAQSRADGARSLSGSRDVFSERAFEAVYQETFPTVWAIARRAADSDADAEDVCQKAYLALYRYWSKGELREPPAHLLYRVAKRGAIDLLRARGRGIRLFARLPEPGSQSGDVGGPLRRAIARLRPDDAALVLMQAASGFSYEELAAIERTTVSAIRSRLHRARKQLRGHYDDEGGVW